MSTQSAPEDQAWQARRRRAGIVAFLAGVVAGFAFFAFFPGLPHVIDWGAIIASLVVGALSRWAWLARIAKKRSDPG
ncbi:hypothetical protein [Streptomyces sp. NPDC059979]|uniref:hypothetical protein n=1 Tax=Streptomyces sp. NPDC059979 TaxID=3347021 RepID=UPI0036ABB6D6